jgi:hypothetical protein
MKHKIFQLLSSLTLKKITNFLLIKISYFLSVLLKFPITWGLPFSISVEPGSLCNLNCLECPSNKESTERENGNMQFAEFKHIFNSIFSG